MSLLSSSTPRRVLFALSGLVVAGVLGGCGTAPNSYLYDRQVYYRAVLHRYPVSIVSIDNSGPSFHPAPVTMGEHRLVLDAQPVAGFTVPVQKVYELTVAPCTRYYLAAQRSGPLVQDWDLVVERTFASGGCDLAKEIEKARDAAAKGQQPPLTSSIETMTMPDIPQPGIIVSPALYTQH
jgi:hypothetical protein